MLDLRYAFALVAFTPLSAWAQTEPLVGRIELVEAGVGTIDPAAFGPPPLFDIYHALISNPNDSPVATLQLEFTGSELNGFLSAPDSPITFREDDRVVTLGPVFLPESFFVVGPDNVDDVLTTLGSTEDSDTRLAADFTLAGPPRLIPANTLDHVIAVLTVRAGTPAPTAGPAFFEVADSVQPFFFVPEPSTGLLAVIALTLVPPSRR